MPPEPYAYLVHTQSWIPKAQQLFPSDNDALDKRQSRPSRGPGQDLIQGLQSTDDGDDDATQPATTRAAPSESRGFGVVCVHTNIFLFGLVAA